MQIIGCSSSSRSVSGAYVRSSGRGRVSELAPATADTPGMLPAAALKFSACSCWCAGSCDTSPAHSSSMFNGGPLGRLSSPPRLSSNRAADSSLHVAGSGVGGVGVWDALAAGSPLEEGAGSVQNIVRTPPDSPMITAGAPLHGAARLSPALGSCGCGGKCPPINSGLTPFMQAAGGQGFGERLVCELGIDGAMARGRYACGSSCVNPSSLTDDIGEGIFVSCLLAGELSLSSFKLSDLIEGGVPSNLMTE